MLLGRPVRELTDRVVPLDTVPGLDGAALTASVRGALVPDPDDGARQQAAVAAVAQGLSGLLPVDDEGLLVNAIVEHIEGESGVLRTGQVCKQFDLSERTLQRLTARRIGLSPKWLIQRRRLHEAAESLKSGATPALARIAVDLEYSDQAHFTRDFRRITGLTPGEYAIEPRQV